jgi:hypothetical protein
MRFGRIMVRVLLLASTPATQVLGQSADVVQSR